MQSIATVARVRRPESKSTPNFEVVLAYQDFSSGIRAKEFFDRPFAATFAKRSRQKAQMEFFTHHFGPPALAFPFAANETQQLERGIPLESGDSSRIPARLHTGE